MKKVRTKKQATHQVEIQCYRYKEKPDGDFTKTVWFEATAYYSELTEDEHHSLVNGGGLLDSVADKLEAQQRAKYPDHCVSLSNVWPDVIRTPLR